MKEKLVVIGSGGHARSVIDSVLDRESYDIVGVLSPSPDDWTPYRGISWVGSDFEKSSLFEEGCRLAVLGVGFLGELTSLRKTLVEEYKSVGFSFPTIIDPSAVVSEGAILDEGVFVSKGAIINASAQVKRFSIINSQALVEHDCTIGAFSHIAVSSVLCGGVTIGEDVLIGANATVIQGLRVGDRAVVGAGALILKNVPEQVHALGIFNS